MKKVLALALGMLLIPFTAFGMETLSDADMDSVTGQSGVAITVDDITLYNEGVSEMWFQVGDAYTSNFAAIGFSGLENAPSASTTFINAIVAGENDATNFGATHLGVAGTGAMGNYMDYEALYTQYQDATGNDYNHANHIGALTITVTGDLPIFSAALESVGAEDQGYTGEVAGVLIGLPSVEIFSEGAEAREVSVSLTELQTDPGDEAGAVSFRYGTLWTDDGGGMAVLGGAVEIAPLESYLAGGGSLYNDYRP